jgi:hypothetical protein
LAVVHWGHTERAGAFSTQLDARRLRLFDLEVFFFGTAIGMAILGEIAALRDPAGHRGPTSGDPLGRAVAGARFLLVPAAGAEPEAVDRAQRGQGQVEQHRVTGQRLEVELVADSG